MLSSRMHAGFFEASGDRVRESRLKLDDDDGDGQGEEKARDDESHETALVRWWRNR